jgi:LAO/AO transport system kinase
MSQDPAEIAARLLAGEVAAGARAIRWLEDGDRRGRAVLRQIFPRTGRAHLVGVTGPPGAGKSTLVDMLVTEERRRGRKVGVIAVDPTSPFTGGAILGDRVRMQRHALDEGVFIRSMGTRGGAGGLSRASYDGCLVMDAMGYDLVIVETVGVGQDEIDIVSLAHSTIVVNVPGLGDEVQAIKAGLMEAGEIFVINKADREGAHDTERQLELMLHLRSTREGAAEDDWRPPLLRAVSVRGEGGAEIADALEAHLTHLQARSGFIDQTRARNAHAFMSLLRDAVVRRLSAEEATTEVRRRLEAGEIDPYAAAEAVAARLESAR